MELEGDFATWRLFSALKSVFYLLCKVFSGCWIKMTVNTRCLLKFESFEAIYNKGQRFLSQLETGLIQSLSKPWEFALGNTEIVSTVGRKWSLSTVLFCCIDDKILQYQNYSWVVKLVWSKLSSQCCLVALGKI